MVLVPFITYTLCGKYSFLKLGADLTEFVAVKSLGLFGSKVTRGILVAVFSAWEENLNNVSEGIREITCIGSLKTKGSL